MAGTSFQLTILVGPNPGRTYPLDKPEMVIGRDLGVDIVINDVEVSRKHAHLVAQQGSYLIEDLGSTNGTVVNGLRLTAPHLLHPGEQIALGEHVTLVYETIQVDPEATQLAASSVAPRIPAAPVEAQPFQTPLEEIPPPPSAYAGQVPAGPVQEEPEPEKKRFPLWTIILIIAILVVICACGAFLKYVDDHYLWCTFLRFLPACQ